MTDLATPSKLPLTEATAPITPGSAIWNAYAAAFQRRYSVAPARNAKTASLCKQLAARFPDAEAPDIATFYLAVEDRLYVNGMHPLELLLRDSEKIRAMWATGHRLPPPSLLSPKGQENMASAQAWMARRRAKAPSLVPEPPDVPALPAPVEPLALPAAEPEWLTRYRAESDGWWEQRRRPNRVED